MVDSFGGGGGAADGGAGGDGSAGDGAPIVGGAVRVVDTTGKLATATTDSQGYFRVKLTGMVPPLIISVTRSDGRVRRSVSTVPLKINGYIFMSVTGLTDKIVSDLAAAAGFTSPAAVTPAMVANLGSQLNSAIVALRNNALVRPQLVAAGLNPDTFDFLNTPFRPNGTGYDAVLDNLIIETDSSGATVLRSANCQAPTSWTVGNVTCTPDQGEETEVPSGGSIIHRDTVGSTRGSVGYSCLRGVLQKPVLPTCTLSTTPGN